VTDSTPPLQPLGEGSVQPTVQPPCNHFDFHDGGRCLLRCMSLLLALFGHADPIERCPLLGPKRKTSARSEYFAF
jgi:hypothetical protein